MKNYTDFCNHQAEKLFKIIEQHSGLLQWQKSWSVKGNCALPKRMNGFYQGINLWNLLSNQIDAGYESSSWLTFNQIKQKGGHVLKGAKGSKVCFFKMKEVQEQKNDDSENSKLAPLFRSYTVFNLAQTTLFGHTRG